MANIQNLRTPTAEQAREIGRKGGLASAEARRRKKSLKEGLIALLETEDNQDQMLLALFREATKGNNSGSVSKAFEVIRDTIGEKPEDKSKTEISVTEIPKVELKRG